ncbi:MAG: hypothetical protein PHC30_01580 [Lentisphaeria bacterium]|nr:hypothetical protein [Lentisphaeria bacterium]
MAKAPLSTAPLTFVEIVMRADAETIKAAYEARLEVDAVLKEREEAYRRIAELENQVETIMGGPGVCIFPEPPLPVAGFTSTAATAKKKKPAVSTQAAALTHAQTPAASTPGADKKPPAAPAADKTKA